MLASGQGLGSGVRVRVAHQVEAREEWGEGKLTELHLIRVRVRG